MFGDDRFEGSFLAESCGKFSAEPIKIGFGLRFFEPLGFEQETKLADLFRDAAYALRHAFKLEGELSALSPEGFHLEVRVGEFGLETAGVAIGASEAFFRLCKLVTKARGG